MIASIKIWMTKERESTNFQEYQKMGVGLVVSFTSGGCGSMFLCLKKYFNRCVLILAYIIDLYGFW